MTVLSDILSIAKSKVVIILFGLGKAVIIARVLGPELNGYLAALLVYPALFMSIGALGVRKSSAFLLANHSYSEDQIKEGIIQAWFVSLLFSVSSIVVLLIFFSSTSYDWYLILLAIIPIPFSLLRTYISGVYLGKNEIQEFNKVDWLPAILSFVGTVVFVWIIPLSLKGALLAELIGPFVISIILIRKQNLLNSLSFKINRSLLKSLFGLGLAYAISLVIINLNYRVDIVIMEWISSKYEIGIYTKGAALTQYLWHIPMMLGTVVFARGARSTDKRHFSLKVCQLLRVSLSITFVGSVCLGILAAPIIDLFFGPAFSPSAEVMIWLLPGVFLLIIFKVLNMDMSSRGRPWFALNAMIPALIVNVLLNIFLIPNYGALGAAFSSTVSYTTGALLFLLLYSRFTGLRFNEIFTYSKNDFGFIKPYYSSLKEFVKL